MTKVMIVDDDMSAQERLREMLSAYNGFKVVLEAGTVEEAKTLLSTDSPDLLFLDVELPDGNGIDLLDFVHEYHPGMYVVVFTAFYKGVNSDAYKHGEDDYLLKPIVADELDKIIRRYAAKSNDSGEKRVDLRHGKVYDTIALMTVNNELRPVKCSEIGFFRYNGLRKLWTAVLFDTTTLTMRKGTKGKDILKLNPMFQQSHQSFIVNLAYVKLIGNTQIRLREPLDLYSIPMGRTFLRSFQERFRLV